MLSFNELSMSGNNMDESRVGLGRINGLNLSSLDSQTNSRQLFRRCKEIIHQQMIQIGTLSEENDNLREKIAQNDTQKAKLVSKTIQTAEQYNEIRTKNQILHKEMNKKNLLIDELSKKLHEKEDIIKLNHNKIELMQATLNETFQQHENYKEKFLILSETVELLKGQNQKAHQIVQNNQLKMKMEIQQLKRVKSILSRRNKIEEIDLLVNNKLSSAKKKEQQFKTRQESAGYSKSFCQPFFTIDQNPFKSLELKKFTKHQNPSISTQMRPNYPRTQRSNFNEHEMGTQKYSNSRMYQLSILREAQNKSPVSRIKKNISKSRNKHQLQRGKQSFLLSIPSKRNGPSINCDSNFANPEIESELSIIKKEILQQYNRMEVKKEMMSQERISQTLQQIENKLQKMTKITAFDQSQFQIE